MQAEHDRSRLTPLVAASLALTAMLLTTVGDFLTPANFPECVLRVIPLALCAWVGSAPFLWGLTAASILLSFAAFIWGRPVTAHDLHVVALTNRGLNGLTLAIFAGLVHGWIASRATSDLQRQSLEEQNAELEELNRELSQREEEIVRQNEELQSQTEELERQSEELRVTNEELASREKTLEQLLELSRSLTAGLTRGELLDRLCEALGALTMGNASAILERQGTDLRISCHNGFGPEGAASETIPLAASFSSLILSMGQTGYLEDVRLRPELVIPQPKEGDPFRSILSTPLRIQGRSVGSIEVYSVQPRTWDEEHVAVIESLAAQASISMQSMELIDALRIERRRFEAAFRTVPFGVAVADDPQAVEVRINPAAAAIFGLPVNENLSPSTPAGARIRRMLHQGQRPVAPDDLPLAKALRGEETQGLELELVLPKGPPINLLFCAAPFQNPHGEIVGAVSAFADISLQKNLQRELEFRRREAEEASQRKTRFLAAVSHDLRTPANAIGLMAELIRRAASNPQLAGEMAGLAERLQHNTTALMELVGDVLDVARFDSGKIELQVSEFSLADVLADECRQVAPLAAEKNLELICEPLDRPIWLHTDRVKLGRILGNLLGNAIKFTQTGTIRVGGRLEGEGEQHVALRVSDTGEGIPPEALERIFDEFAQLHNPERDRTKGTGLGLAICRRLADVMGGTIAVESQAGIGSTFELRLPPSCVAMRLEPPAAGRPQPTVRGAPTPGHIGARLAGLRILIVEDHAATREGVAQLLRQEGAEVAEACDGRSGLLALRAGQPQVLLLDMMLPDMDGREILKDLRANPEDSLRGLLVLTGDLTAQRIEEIRQLGALAVVSKPVNIDKLLETLESLRPR